MSATYDLFEQWKAAKGLPSDNSGAVKLGLSRATVSLWKQGRNAEIQFIEKLANDIGEDPAKWAARVMAERGQTEDERKAWARIARRLGTAAAIALCAVAVPAITSESTTYAVGFLAMPIMSIAAWVAFRLLQQNDQVAAC